MQTECSRKLPWISLVVVIFFYKKWLVLCKAAPVRELSCAPFLLSVPLKLARCYFRNPKAHVLFPLLLLFVRSSFNVKKAPWIF